MSAKAMVLARTVRERTGDDGCKYRVVETKLDTKSISWVVEVFRETGDSRPGGAVLVHRFKSSSGVLASTRFIELLHRVASVGSSMQYKEDTEVELGSQEAATMLAVARVGAKDGTDQPTKATAKAVRKSKYTFTDH